MVAIPPGMMAIDRDDDDGGRAAIAELAAERGSCRRRWRTAPRTAST